MDVTDDPEVELQRCAVSKLYFSTHYYWARTERNTFEPLGKLWDAQVATIKAIDQHPWIFNLKARKLGISTIGCSIDLWTLLFRQHCRVHLFSKMDTDATNLLDRCRAAYYKIPTWMQAQKITINNSHVLQLDFGDGDVRTMQAYSSDPDAGRSESCQHAHLDEIAIIDTAQQEEFWAAVEPSVVPGGTMHIMTTGKGSQNFAAQLWKDSINGLSNVYPVFLSFDMRDDRQVDGWYEEKARTTTPRKLKREYPRNWAEALVDAEKSVFPDEIRRKNYVNRFYIEAGMPGRAYIKSWDVGYAQDAAACFVIDVTEFPCEVVKVELFEHVPYTAIQEIMADIHNRFPGTTYIESNAMGEAVIQNLTFTAIGHYTSPKTKPEAIARLQLLMEKGFFQYNPDIWPGSKFDDELASYTWEDIKLVQDLVMSASIGAYYAHERLAWGIDAEGIEYNSPEKPMAVDLLGSYDDYFMDKQYIVSTYHRDKRSWSKLYG